MGHHPSDCLLDRFGIHLASEKYVVSQQLVVNDGHGTFVLEWGDASVITAPGLQE